MPYLLLDDISVVTLPFLTYIRNLNLLNLYPPIRVSVHYMREKLSLNV